MLSNVSSTSAYIYVDGEGNEQANFVAPQSRAINGEIHLFKRAEHYELIVHRILLKIKIFLKRISRKTMVAMI